MRRVRPVEGGVMDAYEITVRPFEMGTGKDAAVKVLEEASEAREAWQLYDAWSSVGDCEFWTQESLNDLDACNMAHLADELADCIQACCNLAGRYDIDLAAAMARCERRNRERGRYGQ